MVENATGQQQKRATADLIAHLDLDAFFVSVELLLRPELKGKPVIVAGRGPRAVVTTASYEAREYGVGSAMSAAQAIRRCPQAIVVPPNLAAYRESSLAVMAVIGARIERVEQLGLDEAYLDLSGLSSPEAIMRLLVAEIAAETGINASVGIGPNRLVAKVASDAEKPNGFVILTAEEARQRFADAPVRLVPGIGPRTSQRLDKLGIATLVQLREADAATLAASFGARQGPALRALANFEGSAELTTERIAVSESRETTFDIDLAPGPELEDHLRLLAGKLSASLQRSNRKGKTIRIKVRLDDWTTVTRSRTIKSHTNHRLTIEHVALELLRHYNPQRPVRLLGISVTGFAGQDSAQLRLPLWQAP